MKKIRRIYFFIFKRYRRLELRCMTYAEADKLIKENAIKLEHLQWHLAKEEDSNHVIGLVYLERKERIRI